jgi:hypothetical protein
MDSRVANDHTGGEPVEPPISVAHLMRTLRGYLPVIGLTLLAVTILYALVAVTVMLIKPSQPVTTVRFRLNFSGADKGTYPNGASFNASTIISTPVLLKAYRANALDRFCTFTVFSHSIVVLEANPALERLNTEYQARMADPKLTPVDRDRLAREFDAKRDSLGKNEYALNYTRTAGSIPEDLVRKTLSDILVTWSNDAENEQRLLDYPMAVLSPDILNVSSAEANDPMISLLLLRSNIGRILLNIGELEQVPGASVIRTPTQHMSLLEIRLRLEDALRFRVEPLLNIARSSGVVRNPAAMIQFLESQINYDERKLHDLQQRSDAIRSALSVYAMSSSQAEESRDVASQPAGTRDVKQSGETVTPIINDTFLDRIVALSNQSDEARYRQKAADEYHRATLDVIPAQQAVAYDKELLEMVKRGGTGVATSAAQIQADIDAIRGESRALVAQVNEIYQILSRTMNPASQVYSVTRAPTTTIQRTGDLRRSLLGLLFVLLLTLPITVVICLLHNRVREEETAEEEGLVEAADDRRLAV